MENKRKLLCNYFSLPNGKSNDIERHVYRYNSLRLEVLTKLLIDTMNVI